MFEFNYSLGCCQTVRIKGWDNTVCVTAGFIWVDTSCGCQEKNSKGSIILVAQKRVEISQINTGKENQRRKTKYCSGQCKNLWQQIASSDSGKYNIQKV